jgi:glycosyltransferase involved in cell wall biosynthesis
MSKGMSDAQPIILILTPFFYPNRGGVETCLINLVEELCKEKIKTQVITFQPLSSNDTGLNHERFGSVNITRRNKFNGSKKLWSEKSALKLSFYIIKDLLVNSVNFMYKNRKSNIIIHAHGVQASIVALFLKIIFRLKYISSIHSHIEEYHLNNFRFISNIFYPILLKNSDSILVNTSKMKNEFINLGIESTKIVTHVQWNTKDFFKQNKKPIKSLTKIIFVGRLLREKGTRVVLKLAEVFPDVTFTVVGDGIEHAYLQKFGTPNLKLTGALDPGEIADLYFENDICLVPSLYEDAYPRVVTESIGCQTPVIGTLRGGIPEAMDHSVGWLVEGTTEENAAKEIAIILNGILSDPQELNFRIQNCEAWAQEHYSNKIFQKTLAAYLKASKT